MLIFAIVQGLITIILLYIISSISSDLRLLKEKVAAQDKKIAMLMDDIPFFARQSIDRDQRLLKAITTAHSQDGFYAYKSGVDESAMESGK